MTTLAKHGIPLDLERFANICAVAGLRSVELAGFVRRVSAPKEHAIVLVNTFGTDQPQYKLSESPTAPWRALAGGMAEVVLLALGDDPSPPKDWFRPKRRPKLAKAPRATAA